MSIDIEVEDERWQALPGLEGMIEGAVVATLSISLTPLSDRHPGEGRDPAFQLRTGGQLDPGLRRDDGMLGGDVTVLLTSDSEIQQLNKQWRGFDKPTNVLSFPAPKIPLPKGEIAPLGDIALAYETVMREAHEQGKSPTHHTLHLVVHGILHLLGYDHENDAEAEAMEVRERIILAGLGIADPYA